MRVHDADPWEQCKQVRRSLVIPEHRVLYVPVPKAGTSSMRRLLAVLAGLDLARFDANVHDLKLWPQRFQWTALPRQRRHRIQKSGTWLRFTVVRNPWTRLWSSWQSKILLQKPRYADRYRYEATTGREVSWWPRVGPGALDAVADFRRFVHVLADDRCRPVDPHWQPQTTVLRGAPPLTYVGRAEALADVIETLADHTGVPSTSLQLPRSNESLLAYTPAIYDEPTREVVRDVFAADFATFDYPRDPGQGQSLEEWAALHRGEAMEVARLASEHQALLRLRDDEAAASTPDASPGQSRAGDG